MYIKLIIDNMANPSIIKNSINNFTALARSLFASNIGVPSIVFDHSYTVTKTGCFELRERLNFFYENKYI